MAVLFLCRVPRYSHRCSQRALLPERVNFTTGDIKSVIVNIAIQEGLSTEFITLQLLQGGRGPFNVTVSEDLGKFLVEEEEIVLDHNHEH